MAPWSASSVVATVPAMSAAWGTVSETATMERCLAPMWARMSRLELLGVASLATMSAIELWAQSERLADLLEPVSARMSHLALWGDVWAPMSVRMSRLELSGVASLAAMSAIA